MDLGISEQQEMLLYKACRDHDGVVPVSLARQMYSSKSAAHSAIDKLELAGYIEHLTPGFWKVVKVTPDIKQELKQEDVKVEKSENKQKANVGSESEYNIVEN